MIRPFEFYFDFASPYSYLAHKEIRKIEKENSVEIVYMPILLGGILKSNESKANIEIPNKGKYMVRDCKLWAEKYKIPFKFNNYFPINTLNLMRCVLVVEKKEIYKIFIDKIFDSIWKEGLNVSDNKIVEKIFNSLKLNLQTFLIEASSIKIKEDLKKRTDQAYQKGIFGVPSFIINNKMFWGQDRIEFVLNEAKK